MLKFAQSLLVIYVVSCAADSDKKQCVWYGECDVDGMFRRNCPYNGPPKRLNESRALETIKILCPDLMIEAGANLELCCDATQIATLERSMSLPQQMLGRCPACARNFRQLWCQSTCSPRQSRFLRVSRQSRSPRTNKTFVSRMDYLTRDDAFDALFSSCRSVVYPATNQPALDMMCGGRTGDQCNAQAFADFLGHNNMAPMIIDFTIHNESSVTINNETFYPMNASMTPCSSMTPELDLACSCQDCVQSCPPALPYPDVTDGKCYVGSMECMVFVSLLAFVGLCFLIVLMSLLHYIISRSTADDSPTPNLEGHIHGNRDGYYKTAPGADLVNDSEVTVCEKVGAWLEAWLESACVGWGIVCTRRPAVVFLLGLSVSLLCSCGVYRLKVTTDPVALWSAPSSQARNEKQYFDNSFGPFYRTAQIIIVPVDQSAFNPALPARNKLNLGPAFKKDVLLRALELQKSIEALTAIYEGRNVSLKSVCTKPLQPDSEECLVQSPLGWFQNSAQNLNKVVLDDFEDPEFDYVTHLLACIESPSLTNDSKFNLSCLAPYGGPVFPYVAIGNFRRDNYTAANAIVVTYLLKNNVDASMNGPAEAWEKSFIDFMKSYAAANLSIAFTCERSIQDEIARESQSDVATVLLSYFVMFVYIAFSLGQYNAYNGNLTYFLVQSKMVLGLVGVLIVLLSVTSSVGLFSLVGIPATLIIIEVVPFLVLAVGVDNIFILVQAYQRDRRRKNESLEDRMGRIYGEVIPTMLLSSLSECFCFMLGALSTMPAVKTFSLYAGLAILFDFLLQVTCFAALFTLDARRQESGRLEVCCCVRLAPPPAADARQRGGDDGFLYCMVKDYYTPFLLRKPVKLAVLILFMVWACGSLAVVNKIEVGLDQSLAMPEDSYVLKYFRYMVEYLSVGPPVYFVVKGKFDYSRPQKQNLICGSSGCRSDSLVGQVYTASIWSNKSFVAQPMNSWLDDYFDWLRPVGNPPCCRLYNNRNDTFCPSTVQNNTCTSCNARYVSGRPDPDAFYAFLPAFLSDNPGVKCAKGGHAAYSSALSFDAEDERVSGSYFMTYHTVLKTPRDYTDALRNARRISENVTSTMERPGVRVFAYSVFYVFYEQYLTVIHDAILQLIVSLVGIFFVTTLLLGLDPWSAVMIVGTIVLILINLMGLMYWWRISFNAVSLVNLVMSVGISVEFCAHLVRAFKVSCQPSRTERAKEALSSMGSSVLSGITLTKFGGIVVLAFSHSQIFQVFYFRMYMGIVLIGATHGLVFLPVFLSFAGPSLSKYKMSSRSKAGCAGPSLQRQRQNVGGGLPRHSPSSTNMIHNDATPD